MELKLVNGDYLPDGRGGLEQALRSKDRAGVMAEACFKAAGWC